MATIRSLLRVRPRTVAAPLPPLTFSVRSLATARPGALYRRCVSTSNRNLAAVRQPDKPGGDHAFIGVEPALDHRLSFILFLHHDRPRRHRVVVLDHIDEGAVRSALHGTGWNHHHLLERVDQQTNIDKLAGPEL